jgi:glutamate-5-semialdehyde dehydrogenase
MEVVLATDDDSGRASSIMREIGLAARKAARDLAQVPDQTKNVALRAAATAIRRCSDQILMANQTDVLATQAMHLSHSFVDRLSLNPARIEAMAAGVEAIAALPDPVGRVLARFERPNGLKIERVSTPLGVIGVIFESRPNVAADAGALCLKAGNAVILRGGSESFASCAAIHQCLVEGLETAGLPAAAIARVPVRGRLAVGLLLAGLEGCIDVIVPRGGKNLVDRVQGEARVPVFAHLEGVNHVYVERSADLDMAKQIVVNSKLRRSGICGAAETMLVDRACVETHLGPLLKHLIEAGCEVRGDPTTRACDTRVNPASEEDWRAEYLDAIISVRVVDNIDAALDHIATYGTQHSDCIVTDDTAAAQRFLAEVDSAIVLHNASTQFADGGEFGFGAEIGIATGRIHARGPVGVEQLTCFKYRVHGDGQIRA